MIKVKSKKQKEYLSQENLLHNSNLNIKNNKDNNKKTSFLASTL